MCNKSPYNDVSWIKEQEIGQTGTTRTHLCKEILEVYKSIDDGGFDLRINDCELRLYLRRFVKEL